jgi:type I restriction enzyme S subunit
VSIDGWTTRPLGDFLDLITYGFTNPMPTTDVGPYMLTAKDIRGGKIDYATARHTSREAFTSKLTNKSRPQIGDVLLTKDGSIGRVAVCDRSDVCINQSVALLRPSSAILPEFLSYLLQTPAYQRRMESDSDGSTIKHIYITRVDKMPIAVPDASGQRAIVELLGALGDKIAANTKLVERADCVQHTIFRSMLPDSNAVPLSGTARFINGKAFTKGASGTGRVVIRIAELNSGMGGSTVYSDAEVPDDHLAKPGDILFAWSGSLTLHRWFRSPGIVNQHIFKVIPNDPYPHWLIYELIREKLDEFKAIAANKATTMGHIQRRHLDEDVRVPTEEVWKARSGLMENLWALALNAEQENLTLAATRDALLPQLMSGKLRVKDAEAVVGNFV